MLYTIGHSNRSIEELLGLLRAHGIAQLVDVRTIPRSRHNPQFNADALAASLGAVGLAYAHMPGLGGLRHPRADSANTAWRNASFRGYADYMQTREFADSLAALLAMAAERTTTVMCAEAVPWRCHRSLIADALTARGIEVRHVMTDKQARRHTLSPWARIDGDRVTYPALAV